MSVVAVAAAAIATYTVVGVTSDEQVLQGVGERARDIIMANNLNWARIRSDMYSREFEHVQDRL
jgi:hypothetical protein